MKLKYIEVSPSYSIINTVLWNTAGREQHIKKQYEELEEVEEEEVSNLTIVSWSWASICKGEQTVINQRLSQTQTLAE